MLLRWTMFVDIFLAGSQGRREYQALWIRFQNVSRIMGNMICGWHYIYQILQNVKMPPNFTTKCRRWPSVWSRREKWKDTKKQIQNDFPIILLKGILSYVCAFGNFEKNIMTNLVGTKPYSDQLSVWGHFTASTNQLFIGTNLIGDIDRLNHLRTLRYLWKEAHSENKVFFWV